MSTIKSSLTKLSSQSTVGIKENAFKSRYPQILNVYLWDWSLLAWSRASQVARVVKNPFANAGDAGDRHFNRSLGQEDPLEKEMAAHSSILASIMPWTEDLAGYYLLGLRVGHDWVKEKKQAVRKTFPCRPMLRVFPFSNSHDLFGWPYTGPMNSTLTFVQMTFKMSLPGSSSALQPTLLFTKQTCLTKCNASSVQLMTSWLFLLTLPSPIPSLFLVLLLAPLF